MRKETDIESVKSVLKSFLYMDLKYNEKFPFLCDHPIFESPISMLNNEMVDLHDGVALESVRQKYIEMIDKISNPVSLLVYVRSAYYLTFLKYTKDYLSLSDFSKMLAYAWTQEENPNGDVNVSIEESIKWFRSADKSVLMNENDFGVFNSIADQIELYRGVAVGRVPNGLSWTANFDKAKWFSERFGEGGYIQSSLVDRKNVLCYLNIRGEDEYVVDVTKIDIKVG